MRIGLYGGTFDPIHLGHLIVIENAINQMDLDRVIILPSSNPPHKKNINKTKADLRVEMVYEAIKDNPKIILSTYESSNGEVRYTHETLDYFTSHLNNHEIFYIMGEDSFIIRTLVKEDKSIKYLVRDEVDYIVKNRHLYEWFNKNIWKIKTRYWRKKI